MCLPRTYVATIVRPSRVFCRFAIRVVQAICTLLLGANVASAQLSQNSGINANDTYAVFDVTFQGQGSTPLSQALYNPSTNTTSSTLSLTPNVRHFHVEIGYDSNDQLVMNIFSTDPAPDPTQFPFNDVTEIQLRDGKLTVFDETGTPYPISLPNNMPLPQPLSLLGAIPGPSVLNYLVTSNPTSTASAMNGSVQYSNGTTTSPNHIQSYYIPTGTQAQMAYITVQHNSDLSGSATITYEQFSGGWALLQATNSTSLSGTQSSTTAQFANLQWYDNSTGDSRRASKATSPPPAPSFSASNASAPPLPGPATNSATLTVENIGAGPTNLLYQHGIFSSAQTWDVMDPWIQLDFPLNVVAKTSLNSTDYLANQANSLISLVQGTGKTNFLAIGHSNGGAVSRDAAYRGPNLLIDRVITLDATNNGAEMAEFDRGTLAGAMTALAKIWMSWAPGTPLSGAVFTLGNYMLLAVPTITIAAFDSAIPASTDMVPGSAFVNNINSRSEPFKHVGIQGASRGRFVEWRVVGDSLCGPDGPECGRQFYDAANGVYWGLRACEIIAFIFGDIDVAIRCEFSAFIMDYTDFFWYVYTSFGDYSDGIVNGGGQYYNNAFANRRIGGADSHVGATRSDKVRAVLDVSLQNDFNIIPKWCQTGSVSPSSFSVSFLGGSQSFTLSTGSPCPWTAVSNVPWITVISGASGTASGTVQFSVDINLSPVARSGTISITGLGSNVSVTVTQPGLTQAAAIGSVSINGAERGISNTHCVSWLGCYCRRWVTTTTYDHGPVSVTVNGHTDTAYYGQGSTPSSVALALASAINSDSGSYVQAGVMGNTVWLVSIATQGANYAFSSTSSTSDPADFSGPSFTTADSGPTLTGSP